MLDGVGERLLGDAVDGLLGFDGDIGLGAEIGVDGDLVAGARGGDLAFERGDEAVGLDGVGAQLEDEGAKLGEASLGEGEDVVQRLRECSGERLRVAFEQGARGPRAEADAIERLRNRVVEVAGDALALFERVLPAGPAGRGGRSG
ncbi:MAG: hypothetical protein U5Q44_00340 [Dehalococcoidia bacterium]|nr:hypothetical protein [Dehalococcoidia bacterium]